MQIVKQRAFLMPIICALAILFGGDSAFAGEIETIRLPAPNLGGAGTLMRALEKRESNRSFSPKELPVDLLSGLLWAANGVNRPSSGKRTAPSAQNAQEIDIYVATKKGAYLYLPGEHMLEPVLSEDIRKYTGSQDFTREAPVNLIYVADFSRMKGDDEKKVFYSAADTAFISQNVYLFCASEGLSTVVLGWVDKEHLRAILNLGDDKKIIFTQPVGYPK